MSQKASYEEKIKTYKTEIDNLMKRIETRENEYTTAQKQMESLKLSLDEQLQKGISLKGILSYPSLFNFVTSSYNLCLIILKIEKFIGV